MCSWQTTAAVTSTPAHKDRVGGTPTSEIPSGMSHIGGPQAGSLLPMTHVAPTPGRTSEGLRVPGQATPKIFLALVVPRATLKGTPEVALTQRVTGL